MNLSGWRLDIATAVDDEARAAVAELVAVATDADGVAPIDDQVRLDLQYGDGPDASHRHWLVREGASDRLVGYAHVAAEDEAAPSVHLAVAPAARGHGLGTRLVERALRSYGDRPRFWAHGDLPAARQVAERLGLDRTRELLEMRLAGDVELPEPSYPADVTARAFEPGRDEQAWVGVNAAAFAGHPEQGRMTVHDLQQRISQPWFEPAGFFLAERRGELVGFHWTKLERDAAGRLVGEVYVVGVAPQAQGGGLGRALTLTGLLHLRDRGAAEVRLFVESDNSAALSTYRRIGFVVSRADVVYAPPP